VNGTISVAPGMTLDALTTLAAPFLAFIAALVFFQGDDEALWLWRALAYFGAAYAGFGILQELLFPDQLLFETKKYYVGYLTATFVNRNTAGTFFGVALLLNLGLEFHELRKIHVASFVRKAFDFAIGWRDKNVLVLVHAFCCLIIAMALFLTQSRGAVGATFIACVVAVALMSTRRLTADKPGEEFVNWRRYATIIAGLLIVIGLFALFAGRSVYRMQEQGSEDSRWCAFSSTISAIKDNWIFGTGLGAFQDVFPVYRDSDCAGIFGVWERAHNFFLEGWLGLGLPFLAALAIGYLVLVAVFIRGVEVRHQFRFVPVMGLAALVLASLHSIVDFSLQIPGVGVYFAAIMAATVTVSLGRGRE
jgi:O-antigen ligase